MLQKSLCAFIGRVPRNRVPTDVQHAIRKWTKPRVKKTSAPSAIRSFFIDKRRNEGKGRGKRKKSEDDVDDLVEAVRVLQAGSAFPSAYFEDIWGDNQPEEPSGSRQRCLMTTGAQLEKGSLIAEVTRRVVHILVYDNIESLAEVCDPTYTPDKPNTALTAAIDEFTRASGWSEKSVRAARLEGAGYLDLVKHFGIGVVLLTGSGRQPLYVTNPIEDQRESLRETAGGPESAKKHPNGFGIIVMNTPVR